MSRLPRLCCAGLKQFHKHATVHSAHSKVALSIYVPQYLQICFFCFLFFEIFLTVILKGGGDQTNHEKNKTKKSHLEFLINFNIINIL